MFKNLNIKPIYSSYDDNIVEEFYNPIFKNAIKFDRISAYFSAKSLAKYSRGLEYFARSGYKYRLIVSEHISEYDYKMIKQGYRLRENVKSNMISKLKQSLSLEDEKNLSNLAYLISLGIIDIKIAFIKQGIFHDKCGIFYDKDNNIICFRGSNNETIAAIESNYEVFTVTCSWLLDNHGFYEEILTKSRKEFDRLWNNEHEDVIVLEAEEVIMNEILKYNKNEIIIEDTLLENDCIILDYTNRLILRLNTENHKGVTQGPFYKIKLRRYVESIDDNNVYFKEELSYIDYGNLHELIKQQASKVGLKYFATNRLLDYIESRNLYIDKRATLGIEIKRQDERLKEKFEKYSKIVNQNMSRQLRDKQMWDSFFMYAMNKSGNFSVPGSGKTSSVLGVYAFLKYNKIVKKIVMIGPKNSFGSWIDEFKICFKGKEDLRVFNIHSTKYRNSIEKKRALTFDSGNCNLFLFNYESLGTYENEIRDLIDNNTLLVFDEVHKIKKVNGVTPGIYARHALKIAEKAVYTIVMTGTPIPNSYTDIYNMLHILYNDEYKDFFNFSPLTLKNPTQEELNKINDKIQPFFCRTTKEQLKVPPANADEIITVNSTYEEQKLFKMIIEKYKKNKLALFIRLLQMESDPKMLLKSLDSSDFENILDTEADIDEIDFIDYSSDFEILVNSIKLTSKVCRCISLIENLVSDKKKVIVWCIFKDSIKNMQEQLESIGIKTKSIYGEIELNDRLTIIDEFKNGEFDVLITNPHTLAESVSLHSICHDAVYFEYSYNLVHLLQSKDRIHRLGLPNDQYTQYYYMHNIFSYDGDIFSIDEQIYDRLMEKEKIMLDAIDNNELEDVFTPEEDLDLIFGKLFT